MLVHADAAGIADDEARFLNYFGRTEDRRGAWARWLDHEAGTSGATRLCRLLREQRLAKYYVRSSCCVSQLSLPCARTRLERT